MPKNKKHPLFDPLIMLSDASFSKELGYFNGRSYSPLIQKIAGVSLWTAKIDSKTVKLISKKLDELKIGEKTLIKEYDFGLITFESLQRMFRAYVKLGAHLECNW